MTDLNHVVLIGNLTRDVGDGYSVLSNGTAKASVSIAVNRSKKNGDQWVDEVSYFDITIWGKTAENLKPYLVKGQKIAVDGYLKQDRWEKDGQKFSKIQIVANSVQLVGARNAENQKADFQPENIYPQQNSDNWGGYSDSEFGEGMPF